MNGELNYKLIRDKNLEKLKRQGFEVAASLPLGDARNLRPIDEIARRLWAVHMLFLFTSDPGKSTSTNALRDCIARNDLTTQLNPDERAIVSSWRWRARRRHRPYAGWRLENMLSLAWILGFEVAPKVSGNMLHGEPLRRLIRDFLGPPEVDVDQWRAARSQRPIAEIAAKEDLFYCAHNAVRSAQLGQHTVPPGFHPIANGGVVHERRHALTWSLSPGVAWDDTDLST